MHSAVAAVANQIAGARKDRTRARGIKTLQQTQQRRSACGRPRNGPKWPTFLCTAYPSWIESGKSLRFCVHNTSVNNTWTTEKKNPRSDSNRPGRLCRLSRRGASPGRAAAQCCRTDVRLVTENEDIFCNARFCGCSTVGAQPWRSIPSRTSVIGRPVFHSRSRARPFRSLRS